MPNTKLEVALTGFRTLQNDKSDPGSRPATDGDQVFLNMKFKKTIIPEAEADRRINAVKNILESGMSIQTLPAGSIANVTATINGSVSAYSLSTVVSFDYWEEGGAITNTAAAQSPLTPSDPPAPASVSKGLTGLTQLTKYYYRVKAVNDLGTLYGEILNFTTIAT